MRIFPAYGTCVILLTAISPASGCGGSAKPVKTFTMTRAPGPLDEVRALLVRYAEGQPVGSEATNFEGLVARLREHDPASAATLEEGLAAIVQSPATAASRSRTLLEQLGPAPPGR